MQHLLPDFSHLRILVVGDVMLDRYWQGATSRISPEAPVPVINVGDTLERAGGAGNVARNITAMSASASLVGVVGEDDAAVTLERVLLGDRVECALIRSKAGATITKLRVLSRHQQLIRLDFEKGFPDVESHRIQQAVLDQSEGCDAVVLSDYGKGTLTAVPELIDACIRKGKPVLVDPKLEGEDFIQAYRNATLITPNMGEFESVVGVCANERDLRLKGIDLVRQMNLQALLVTRSDKGMILFHSNGDVLPLPTRSREVYDVTGAGDTVIAMMAMALAAGMQYPEAIRLANTAAGIVVGKLGTATVSPGELQEHSDSGVVSREDLLERVEVSRSRGERIVMTNGCFDIMHAGHVACLAEAAAMGDRLIVAVNDDHSVKRLKGVSRPVIPLQQRMSVLAALASVDWVVAFSEDTPRDIICEVCPDVLVKGGDYTPEEIAGSDCVQQNGGQVVIIDLLQGCSTSNIIKSIKDSGL